MLQIPYSISRMLCHILIGFVGGSIFINAGKVPAIHSLHDMTDRLASPAAGITVISLPLREITDQDQAIPGGDKPLQPTD